jgi:hypothetical protein
MDAVYQQYGNTGTDLGCTANDVSTTVIDVQGPTSCKKGDSITVNVTTSVYFSATRYDFAIYTLTDTKRETNDQNNNPLFGVSSIP